MMSYSLGSTAFARSLLDKKFACLGLPFLAEVNHVRERQSPVCRDDLVNPKAGPAQQEHQKIPGSVMERPGQVQQAVDEVGGVKFSPWRSVHIQDHQGAVIAQAGADDSEQDSDIVLVNVVKDIGHDHCIKGDPLEVPDIAELKRDLGMAFRRPLRDLDPGFVQINSEHLATRAFQSKKIGEHAVSAPEVENSPFSGDMGLDSLEGAQTPPCPQIERLPGRKGLVAFQELKGYPGEHGHTLLEKKVSIVLATPPTSSSVSSGNRGRERILGHTSSVTGRERDPGRRSA